MEGGGGLSTEHESGLHLRGNERLISEGEHEQADGEKRKDGREKTRRDGTGAAHL